MAPFHFSAARKKSTAPVVKAPALLPNEQEPWGLWSLNKDPNTPTASGYVDRVNGRNLSFQSSNGNQLCPSIIPGLTGIFNPAGEGPYRVNDNDSANGEITFCGTAMMTQRHTATRKTLIANDGTRWISMSPSFGYWGTNNWNANFHESTIYVPDTLLGKWFFFSYRRNSDRDLVRFQLETTFQSIAVTPGQRVYSRLNIGQALSFPNELFPGAVCNLGYWTKWLPDADMLRFRNISLGL